MQNKMQIYYLQNNICLYVKQYIVMSSSQNEIYYEKSMCFFKFNADNLIIFMFRLLYSRDSRIALKLGIMMYICEMETTANKL